MLKNINHTAVILVPAVIIVVIFALFLCLYLKSDTTSPAPVPSSKKNDVASSTSLSVKTVPPLTWQTLTPSNKSYKIKNNALYYMDPFLSNLEEIKISDKTENILVVDDSFIAKDDTTLYFGGYPIQGVDMATFEIMNNDGFMGYFAKDKNHVYYFVLSSSIVQKFIEGRADAFIVPEADSATFVVLDSSLGYAKDKNHVYVHVWTTDDIVTLPGADPATFQFVGSNTRVDSPLTPSDEAWYGFFGKDASHVYFREELMPSSDSQSFKILKDTDGNPTGYALDKNNVYNSYSGNIIEGADPTTFTILNDTYAKDKNMVYTYDADVFADNVFTIGMVVPGADAVTFELVSSNTTHDAKDAGSKFLKGKKVE